MNKNQQICVPPANKKRQICIPPPGTLLVTKNSCVVLRNKSDRMQIPAGTPLLLLKKFKRQKADDGWSVSVLYENSCWRIHEDDLGFECYMKFSYFFDYKVPKC